MYRFPPSLTLSTKTLAMITASTSYSAASIVASKVSGGPSTSQMIPLLHVEGQRRRVGRGVDAEHHSGSGVVENGMRPTRAV